MPKASKKADYNNVFARRLRGLMEQEPKTTQNELAKAIGVSRQSISQYTDGSTQPTLDKFDEIAKYFHVSADFLLGKVENPTTDIEIRRICEHTGLSENAVKTLVNVNRDAARGERVSTLSKMLEHPDFIDLLGMIHIHVWNFNRDGLRLDTEEAKAVAHALSCNPLEVRHYLEASSESTIKTTVLKIVKDIESKSAKKQENQSIELFTIE